MEAFRFGGKDTEANLTKTCDDNIRNSRWLVSAVAVTLYETSARPKTRRTRSPGASTATRAWKRVRTWLTWYRHAPIFPTSTSGAYMASRSASAETIGFMLDIDPVRAAFQRRSMGALGRISAQASTETLTEALAATTDIGTLARVLGDANVLGAAVAELEPLAPLIARNAEHRLALLGEGGGTLSAEEVGRLLGITRQAVDKRRRMDGLLAFRRAGGWRYPRCQFDEEAHEVLAGVAKVVRAFADAGPWVTLDFLLAADDTLEGRSPIEALRAQGWTEDFDRLLRIERGDGFG